MVRLLVSPSPQCTAGFPLAVAADGCAAVSWAAGANADTGPRHARGHAGLLAGEMCAFFGSS